MNITYACLKPGQSVPLTRSSLRGGEGGSARNSSSVSDGDSASTFSQPMAVPYRVEKRKQYKFSYSAQVLTL